MNEFEKYATRHCGINSLKLHDFRSLANYAKKILEDREQGQKIYEKLYEMKVVEDVKSKIKVTEKAVSAEEFAKLAKEI